PVAFGELDVTRATAATHETVHVGTTGNGWISAATARGAAVQALVAAAVADHDRAAFGAAGGVLLDLERYVRRAQRQGHGRGLAVAVGVAVRGRPATGGVAVHGEDA